jgi:hypothetical protein
VSQDEDGIPRPIWLDHDITPQGRGWCVILHGIHRTQGTPINIPVYVEQSGRAWRNDKIGAKKYNGGADGLYAPPGFASQCRLPKKK